MCQRRGGFPTSLVYSCIIGWTLEIFTYYWMNSRNIHVLWVNLWKRSYNERWYWVSKSNLHFFSSYSKYRNFGSFSKTLVRQMFWQTCYAAVSISGSYATWVTNLNSDRNQKCHNESTHGAWWTINVCRLVCCSLTGARPTNFSVYWPWGYARPNVPGLIGTLPLGES